MQADGGAGAVDELMTARQVAQLRGVSVDTVYGAAREGRLAYRMVLDRIAFRRPDAEAWQPAGHGGVRPGQGRKRKATAG